MKIILILLTMTTKAIAFEQVYALNCAGKAHTDSDGIVYQTRNEKVERNYLDENSNKFDIGTVPKSDRPIYYSYEFAWYDDNPRIYHLPLESDGTYVLIAKLINTCFRGYCYINMKLNNIQLLSNVDPFDHCGGHYKGCDKYFYICVADKKLYYGNQSSLVKDNQIRVEISAYKNWVNVAGLVMLKGTLGEIQKLIGSATKATVIFDPLKKNSECLTEVERNTIKLQKFMEISEQSLKNISKLNADTIISSIDGVSEINDNPQVTVGQEKNIQKDQCHGTNMQKQFADQTNKIIETLKSNVKRNEEMTLKIQTEQANMKL
jgi:Malectin domain